MAIKLTRLSSNLQPEFARTLETRLIARLSQATSVKIAMCAECTALRSRVENGNWILTLGAVNSDDLRRIGAQTGVKTFMEIDFTYSPASNVVWMAAVVYRASDGVVVWSDAYRSDATMTALLRTGKVIQSRAERAAELDRKLQARPYYGWALSGGYRADRLRRRDRRHHGLHFRGEILREVRREPVARVRPDLECLPDRGA